MSENVNACVDLIPPSAAKDIAKPTPFSGGDGSRYGKAALKNELEILAETREGGRNAKLNKAAFSLAQLVAGGELEQVQVETALLSAAVSLGLTEAEAQTTIKSGMDAGAREPRTVPAGTKVEEWPEHPVSLDLPPLPTFTTDDFPPDLWEMVSAVSKANETPTELAGMLALAVVATTCQRGWVVEPEPGYREPLNIWTLSALGPGNRKSSVEKAMTLPLTEWEIEQAQIMSPQIKSIRLMRESQEARLKELQKQFAKSTDDSKRQYISKQIQDVSSEMVEVPVKPQLIAQDVTPERLGALLAIHGERMSIFSAEGGIFENIAGRYSNGTPNLDIFLQSYSGDSVRVDRASREPICLISPALTMGLCVQPDVIKSMASKPSFRGRGLLARFLYALPQSPLGNRKLEAMPVPHAIEFNYKRKVHALLGMPPPETRGGIPVIKLSPEAWGAWKNFQREVENKLSNGGEYEHMQDWAGKLPGAAARIAGLFHCFVHAGKQPNEHQVSLETMNRVLSLAEKVSLHTLAVYDLMEADGEIVGARKILVWITRGGYASFTGHQCHSALKGTFQKRAGLDPALQTLIERGYIRKLEVPGSKGPGRPAEAYSVHPAIQSG